MKLTVVVTVYNEKDTIEEAIRQAKELSVDKEIIIVDNCSTDGTREILEKVNDPLLEIVYQPKNYGYGKSVITGMEMASGEFMYVHNSDLEYDPECVYRMLKVSEEENLDSIFGSRLLSKERRSVFRILKERPFYLGTVITTFLTNLFYGKHFADIIGNRFYRTKVLREINAQVWGIGFDFEVVSKLCKYGYKIGEVPVKYKPRTKGKKIKAVDIIPAVLTMLKIRFFDKRPNRILLIRTDRFGEFILNTPVIRAIKEKFPFSYLCVMVNPAAKEIIEGSSYINEIMIYDERVMRGFFKNFKLITEIRNRRFDLAIILNPKKKFNIITFLADIPIRLGYNRKWGFLLTHKIKDRKFLGQRHEVNYNLDLVRILGIDTEDKRPFVAIDRGDEESIEFLLKEINIVSSDLLIALHPWTSDPAKQWPIKNFSRLAQRLSEEFSCRVTIIGGKDEMNQAKEFFGDKPYLIDLTGKLTLRQSAALLKKCRFLISNDSGPVHLACAVGTPVIALFRNDIPAKSARRWGPWGEGHIVIEKNNLADITVDEVLSKIEEAVNR